MKCIECGKDIEKVFFFTKPFSPPKMNEDGSENFELITPLCEKCYEKNMAQTISFERRSDEK